MTFKQIREGKFSKVIASYLAIQMMIQFTGNGSLFALTSGPSQPEFNSFTPIGTSDMVDLSTGNFNYNIPIMDVGGYPLNLAYDSGVTTDQEASWVGLGWNLSVGQIARQVRGIPDDFKGDQIRYENDMRTNVTVGTNLGVTTGLFGIEFLNTAVGLGVQYNNYEGITFSPSLGVGFQLNKQISLGLNIRSTASQGASVTPNLNFSSRISNTSIKHTSLSGGVGVTYNSRRALENFSMSGSVARVSDCNCSDAKTGDSYYEGQILGGGAGSKTLSFNDQSYTPTKRAGLENLGLTFNSSIGGEAYGGEIGGELSGYGSYQKIRQEEKDKKVATYGYDYTEVSENKNDILDFNRYKEKTFNKYTVALPVTTYTYDLYNIQAQGTGGMFRPHRSQISYVRDNYTHDYGAGLSFGGEVQIGNAVKGGVDFEGSPTLGHTSNWDNKNYAVNNFTEKGSDINDLKYEPSYFKMVGELDVDAEGGKILNDTLLGTQAIKLRLGGQYLNRKLYPTYVGKDGTTKEINNKIKRLNRQLRNQNILKVTNDDAINDPFVNLRGSNNSGQGAENDSFEVPGHHNVGMKILKEDGSTYVFGEAAYNKEKVDATFDVSGSNTIDCNTGLVGYNGSLSNNHSMYSDQYLSRTTTPAYAHTYLLTSVLSSDYEDLTGDGPTDDDLGAYTKFSYTKINDYKWRVPFEVNKASYNEGLKSNDQDQKGSYVYGVKELKYVSRIETKTHIAMFEFLSGDEERKDGIGVSGPNGGPGSGKLLGVDKIYLYSKPEFEKLTENTTFDNLTDDQKKNNAIKVAYFKYDYSLCPETPNSLAATKGKLTLKKVFFTYRNSNMGMYTPYEFSYGELDTDGDDNFDSVQNEDYNLKGHDVWGNYKENTNGSPNCLVADDLTNAEFPYVEQDKATADKNVVNWTLTSVKLPSGGEMKVNFESDDYAYVQDRRVMQMFKITGVGNEAASWSDSQVNTVPYDQMNNVDLYNGSFVHSKYMYVKVADTIGANLTQDTFKEKFLAEHIDKPIFFRTMLNMHRDLGQLYDYVEGYFEIDQTQTFKFNEIASGPNTGTYVAIPMLFLNSEGGLTSGDHQVNPIAKAGWFFGRTYLNRIAYNDNGNEYPDVSDFSSLVEELRSSLNGVVEIFQGPNRVLEHNYCAQKIVPKKSWVRLLNAGKRKFGGGLRVKKVRLFDNWNTMTEESSEGQFYGQEYNYDKKEGGETITSGVATYEANSNKENPFVEPFYGDNPDEPQRKRDKLIAPKDTNYTELPLGETFFPSAKVTYSRVEVKNLDRGADADGRVIKRHATGKVVNEFYTTRDYPTKASFTEMSKGIDTPDDSILSAIISLASVTAINHLALSQGIAVETNDMNGKPKGQFVYQEGEENSPISSVEYKYALAADGSLNNNLTTIAKDGTIAQAEIGLQYEVINDFRENYSNSVTLGFDANLAGFTVGPAPLIVPMAIPSFSYHENILRTAATTKVIHRNGILKEKIATDLGSSVSTENLAWDAHTGQLLLTRTVNEYDDNYFSLTFPSHWNNAYSGMDKASINIGMTGKLEDTNSSLMTLLSNSGGTLTPDQYFTLGDEIIGKMYDNSDSLIDTQRFWITAIKPGGVELMNDKGQVLNHCQTLNADSVDFKVVRSGYRNLQSASMASITMMKNPLLDANGAQASAIASSELIKTAGVNTNDPRIINASAVEYKDFWMHERETGLPHLPSHYQNAGDDIDLFNGGLGFNPYLYNVKGDWRAVKSYAYLTSRNSSMDTRGASTRNEGFFNEFTPFYELSNGSWTKDANIGAANNKWTYASEVTRYSAYGGELENRDALLRYSSAQYGYKNTLPIAVASNSEYREMGVDPFEYVELRTEYPHFQIGHALKQDAVRSTEEAHTGKMSLKMSANSHSHMHKRMDAVYTTAADECEISPIDNDATQDISSFRPYANKKYVVSAWVKEKHSTPQMEYTKAYIGITYNAIANNYFDMSTPDIKFYPSGDVIDGWQRIIGIVEMPENPGSLSIGLYNSSSDFTYFDDLRFWPYNSNLKSFVYDADTQRLMAELDENNYATYYEYDLEGGLVRVKKETEKGVYTIQETRSGNVKN